MPTLSNRARQLFKRPLSFQKETGHYPLICRTNRALECAVFCYARALNMQPMPTSLRTIKWSASCSLPAPMSTAFRSPLPRGNFTETVFFSNHKMLSRILSHRDQYQPGQDSVPTNLKYQEPLAAGLSYTGGQETVTLFPNWAA